MNRGPDEVEKTDDSVDSAGVCRRGGLDFFTGMYMEK